MALAQFHRHTHTMPIDTVVSVTAVTQCVYVIHTWKKYTPRAQMTSVFEGQPLKTRPFLSKTRGPSWVPGIYIYIFSKVVVLVHLVHITSLYEVVLSEIQQLDSSLFNTFWFPPAGQISTKHKWQTRKMERSSCKTSYPS